MEERCPPSFFYSFLYFFFVIAAIVTVIIVIVIAIIVVIVVVAMLVRVKCDDDLKKKCNKTKINKSQDEMRQNKSASTYSLILRVNK